MITKTRVVAAAVVRLAFMHDFLDPDFSWSLTDVYSCTIVERNLAEVVADLPLIYSLLHNGWEKSRHLFSQMSSKFSTTQKSSRGDQSSAANGSVAAIVTIGGSAGKGKSKKNQSTDTELGLFDDGIILREVSNASDDNDVQDSH